MSKKHDDKPLEERAKTCLHCALLLFMKERGLLEGTDAVKWSEEMVGSVLCLLADMLSKFEPVSAGIAMNGAIAHLPTMVAKRLSPTGSTLKLPMESLRPMTLEEVLSTMGMIPVVLAAPDDDDDENKPAPGQRVH